MAWENTLGDQLVHENHQNIAETQLIQYFNLVIKSARGSIVTDVEGKKYIDLLGSDSAMNIGHNHPKVVEAMKKQIDNFIGYDAGYFTNPVSVKLGARLAALAPGNGRGKVAYGTSGSDATEALIKFSRAATGRSYIVSYEGAYHGSTYGALTAGACDVDMIRKIGPLLPNVVHVPYPNLYRRRPGESEHDVAARYFEAFKRPFETYLPVEETAGVIMEPIQGDSGIIIPPKEYVQLVYNFCHDHGIMFAVDEINQGLGRTGTFWSYQHFGITPDLLATGKSLACALPMSAVLGSAEIMDSLKTSAYVFTAGGNPVVAAAALATLDVIDDEDLVHKSAVDGEYARQQFEKLADKYHCIGDIRVLGLNGGIELVKDRKTKEPDPAAAAKVIYRAFQKGVIMVKLHGNVLRFQPPLTISRQLLDQAFEILDEVFNDLEHDRIELPEELIHEGW
ncbi:aspartate aminotransferase family protein [Limosilactobacillus sp.]|jgi:4-aminobutyrate aminotransferase|uniref:aspartate aminotransferase family protein n=1 Tax=Limosilactobacillus sp. TaxID=2773925 RepID=UPI0025C002EE|nr:aspartate aminotransferase family protein [Limosilactobacillus sp.]MCH3922781.1 aspartate aminotransferase family protein [Limosilactobacillus sp.]MCH3927464.1 aspartate aminotransferase family protein [Limosilactobacillus sp.]